VEEAEVVGVAEVVEAEVLTSVTFVKQVVFVNQRPLYHLVLYLYYSYDASYSSKKRPSNQALLPRRHLLQKVKKTPLEDSVLKSGEMQPHVRSIYYAS